MREVREYPLKMASSQVIDIPDSPLFLHVIMEKDGPHLLAEVNTLLSERPYTVEMIATGRLQGPEKRKYIDSFNIKNNIWNVYLKESDE